MKRAILLLIPAVLIVLAFAGCASIIHGSRQTISFTSDPPGAYVEVFTYDQSEGSCETPCSLSLRRKKELRVEFTKQGYEPLEMTLERGTDGWVWGNILFGGIIGIVVDFSNGAAYKLKPGQVNAVLAQTTMGDLPEMKEDESIGIIDIAELSPQEQQKVRQLEKIEFRAR